MHFFLLYIYKIHLLYFSTATKEKQIIRRYWLHLKYFRNSVFKWTINLYIEYWNIIAYFTQICFFYTFAKYIFIVAKEKKTVNSYWLQLENLIRILQYNMISNLWKRHLNAFVINNCKIMSGQIVKLYYINQKSGFCKYNSVERGKFVTFSLLLLTFVIISECL